MPVYACAIIHDQQGRYLVEARDPAAQHAGGLYTCFGGALKPQESVVQALIRELIEELHWDVAQPSLQLAVQFYVGSTHIADFFTISAPLPIDLACHIPNRQACWITGTDPQLSPWHRAALDAFGDGQERCTYPLAD